MVTDREPIRQWQNLGQVLLQRAAVSYHRAPVSSLETPRAPAGADPQQPPAAASRPATRRSWLLRWPEQRWAPLVLLVLGFIGFGAVAGGRLLHQSSDPHFVYQADAWLHGKVAIDPPPQKGDDWAKVESVELDDGQVVRGRRLTSAAKRGVFRTTSGDEIPTRRIRRTRGLTYYVSFPGFPTVLMLPGAAMGGRHGNDVFPTVLVAALILPLAFLTLRRLVRAGLSQRSAGEDVWWVLCLAFGSVFYFSAVQGRVWYTAHVVGVALALGYVWCSIEARHPIGAGLCLGFAAVTRTPMAFMFPLFLFEAWRMSGGMRDRRRLVRTCVAFAAPVVVIAIAAMAYNQVRFGAPTAFGHQYLAVRQQAEMEEHGLFSIDYLSRNLAVALALLPHVQKASPHVIISGHGLALWFTSPILLFVLWPRERGTWHRPLWLCVALVAIPSLLYQNSGWQQFGYRFSLDYMVLLVLLLAVGGRPLRRLGKGLIVAAIAINLFGAITFARNPQFYRHNDFSVVIRH